MPRVEEVSLHGSPNDAIEEHIYIQSKPSSDQYAYRTRRIVALSKYKFVQILFW